MRTSRISQETTKIFRSSVSDSHLRLHRTTRSKGKGLSTFTLGYNGGLEVKERDSSSESESNDSTTFTADIEDGLVSSTASRKRKRGQVSQATSIVSTTVAKSAWT